MTKPPLTESHGLHGTQPATTAHIAAAAVPGASVPAPSPLLAIKAELRAAMNGVAATRIRQSGMDYKLTFGVELPRLQAIAAEFAPDAHLAQALWHEDIRECRILATMLYPTDSFCEDIAEVWTESIQMKQAELAQYLVMNLLCKQPYASTKAFEWMASERPVHQLLGFLLIGRLLMQGRQLSPSAEDEFLDQTAAIHTTHLALHKAVQNALLRFADTGSQRAAEAQQILSTLFLAKS